MVAVSHGLEDIIFALDFGAELFVFFQEFKYFREEKDKYLKLDQMCEQIFVFVDQVKQEEVTEFQNTTFVELAVDDPARAEWNIIINHPQQPATFITQEVENKEGMGLEEFRKFNGFLTFSSFVTKQAVKQLCAKLNNYGITYQPVYQDYQEERVGYQEQKLGVFLDKSLHEIENKVEKLQINNRLLSRSLQENKKRSLELVQRLCFAAEYRNKETALHLIRMSYYAAVIYEELTSKAQKVEQIRYAALMHDIGKIGIADDILLKPGSLTDEEYETMKTHTTIGANILAGSDQELIQVSEKIARHHHEKWDGSGYPAGLEGSEIPLEARVVAIADVFDALSSSRVYKDAYSIEQTMEIIEADRDQHFSGRLVDILEANLDSIVAFKDKIDRLAQEKSEQELLNSFFNLYLNH